MSALRPVAVYGLEVPCGDMAIDGNPQGIAASYRITMAAIDPTADPQIDDPEVPPRATLKMIRLPADEDDDEDDEDYEDDDIEAIERRLGLASDDEDGSSDEESNGGPGEKTKKARAEALLKALQKEEDEEDEAMDTDLPNGVNGTKLNKGKAKASDDDEDESSDEDLDDDDIPDIEEFVICTLDSKQTYQQPIDITINPGEQVYFKVSGAYDIHLTGNYIVPEDEIAGSDDDEDSDEEDALAGYDMDELMDEEDYSEEDELDGIEDPRITEVDSEEEAPKLIEAKKDKKNKNKNKRAAEESDDEDAITADILKKILKPDESVANGEEKLSKKQKKKLKNNAGEAAEAPKVETKPAEKKESKKESKKEAKKEAKEAKENGSANGSGKKVQFADKLEQGPTPTKAGDKKGPKTWTVNGVKIDERKAGSGPGAKKGDKIGMRYIGKLKDGKVFDSNTKGEPFKFKLGQGDVIKGWDIGVAGMAVGSERRIVVPAHLAYGKKSMAGIPANSELTFDLKLLALN